MRGGGREQLLIKETRDRCSVGDTTQRKRRKGRDGNTPHSPGGGGDTVFSSTGMKELLRH